MCSFIYSNKMNLFEHKVCTLKIKTITEKFIKIYTQTLKHVKN